MAVIYLEILEGPNPGTRFKIREGLRIGRVTGEILIDDPKVSSLHAQVIRDEKGQLAIEDRDSNNGLRINDRRVKRVTIMLGVKFRIGKTVLKVVEGDDDGSPEIVPIPLEDQMSWKERILDRLPKLPARNLESQKMVEAFRPALQLEFREGVQMDQVLILGYGPRRFGSDVLDVEILEKVCPPVAFEIVPRGGAAIFKTVYPKLVLLNHKPQTEAELKEGDLIRIGQTIIHVGYAS